MKNKSSRFFLFILILALAFRLPGLSIRTMHGDEAVNALKYDQLISDGIFEYDAREYHGPSLYYFTLPLSLVTSQFTLVQLSENTLRLVTVLFSILLLFILFLSAKILGKGPVLISLLLMALSPIIVFYSRYYIHEMILVFSLYAFIILIFLFIKRNNILLSVSTGLVLALLLSTKETWLIYLAALGLSVLFTTLFYPQNKMILLRKIKALPLHAFIVFAGVVIVSVVLFYSSFLKDFNGLINAFSALGNYMTKSVESTNHIYPWYMYFKWLFYSNGLNNLWGEAFIALFCLVGLYRIFKNRKPNNDYSIAFYRVLALFFIFSSLFFSVIPYKTPWNALCFWTAAILIAGLGIYELWLQINSGSGRYIFTLIVAALVLYYGWQSIYINFRIYEDPQNPYTYAQPTKELLKIKNTLEQISKVHADKKNMRIDVIAKDSDYWPLPWYLKEYKQTGWWNDVDKDYAMADIIIIDPESEEKLIEKIFENQQPGKLKLYIPAYKDKINLRPYKKLQLFVAYEIWNKTLNESR